MRPRYFPMPKGEVKTTHAVQTSEIENGLQTMLRSKDNVLQCEHCGCRRLHFVGLGEYVCTKCNQSTYNNYGKVRACLDINKTATIAEVCEQTGLSRTEIQELIDNNSISVAGGRIWL